MDSATSTPNGARWRALLRTAALVFALVSVCYHLWLIFQGLIPNLVSRPLHLALALPWLFFFAPCDSAGARVTGWLLGGLGIGACLWVAIEQSALGDQYGLLHGPFQIAAGSVLLLTVLMMPLTA